MEGFSQASGRRCGGLHVTASHGDLDLGWQQVDERGRFVRGLADSVLDHRCCVVWVAVGEYQERKSRLGRPPLLIRFGKCLLRKRALALFIVATLILSVVFVSSPQGMSPDYYYWLCFALG